MTIALKIGIASVEKQRQWALDTALEKRQRQPDDPSLWFPSLSALARVISDENRVLLDAIRDLRPESVSDLAKLVGKEQSNVSRSLHMMEPYGLVKLTKNGRNTIPEVPFEELSVVIS